ncbi:conjugal transfer protein TraF [Sphingobium cupriresistens]|uniref:Thioredoxin n=1 Tax=Sphingobium cupriresistens LL01 TaxID=1420583 RepID=A0A0J8AVT9_9SPHN|nr:conjugal transfer protein TraF [Sphingobium cupriresistens]KMS58330.1 thioredoxin [Sphingobium cupriresistens LL01]
MKHVLKAWASLAALLIGSPAAAQADPVKRGFWWYALPKPTNEAEEAPPEPPLIPPMAELARWSPPRIAKLITEQRDYAATVLTVDAVADFWRLQDFARRKARAFAGVTQLALLTHPELSARSAYPVVGDARDAQGAQKDAARRAYLRAKGSEFALVMFSRASCGYCRVQWPLIQRFQDEMGWQVSAQDLDRRPDLKARFAVEVTPTTMIIRRGTNQRMVIANGVEAYPNLIQTAYQAVKLLSGDIRPEQFLTGVRTAEQYSTTVAAG